METPDRNVLPDPTLAFSCQDDNRQNVNLWMHILSEDSGAYILHPGPCDGDAACKATKITTPVDGEDPLAEGIDMLARAVAACPDDTEMAAQAFSSVRAKDSCGSERTVVAEKC